MRLLAEIVQHRFKGPRVLHNAWAAGQISDDGVTASWSTLASAGTVSSRLACLGADGSISRP